MKRNYEQELMEAITPFVNDYQQFPRGFAETDNLNDIDECQKQFDELMKWFRIEDATFKKRVIKIEKDRWTNGKNAYGYGRLYARLVYLKSKN